ncbi:MAG: FtsW/RodA/SpoVE family cell cycle protein [Sphingomonadaceae bacterium]|uniref:FtsW/RodA/SpoVE family cell cycle protein n=1 Tax=Thermaurantiacus sp. TaxID=2820283 RepID=UPI00298F0C34|nr:FtsW/RodA/SpoVE family cell cycle protein [Thermaurantiacus sp.]MCS6986917.1 FtsW/RodA/SpoVE family cell cycle protein [Sphingomonadaceae bacterium]MDW8415483.1 FtsW/RodA/SpoVE family cell cycle protein [Thermaurantiacus sp.]
MLTHLIRPGRADRSAPADWFRTVDRPLLFLILLLMGFGILAVAAASPAAALRLSDATHTVPPAFFLHRQLGWLAAGLLVLIGVSLLPASAARRLALLGTVTAVGLLALVPFVGIERNGATRWLEVAGQPLQPSEFVKPLFAVFTAWLLSARFEDQGVPVLGLSAASLGLVVGLLVLEPDFGQAALIGAVWLAQALLAGLPLGAAAAAGLAGLGGLSIAYLTSAHVARRIDAFLHGAGDTYQVDRALEAFRAGGLLGAGPGDGAAKFHLPEAHTDYIFAVVGEEFGALAGILLALLYLAIALRVLLQLLEEDEPFTLLAAAGLTLQFAGQAFLNMSVNLALAPAKGMTLPLVSYGGSSYLASALGLGLLLALTRRNRHLRASPFLRSAGEWR